MEASRHKAIADDKEKAIGFCLSQNPIAFLGATDVTRTHDLLITNQLLYRLSYSSIYICEFGRNVPLRTTTDLLITSEMLYH